MIMSVHLCLQREDYSKLSMLRKLLRIQGKFYIKIDILLNSTILGVVCKDGIILGTEKIVLNKMMINGTDKRVYSVNLTTGAVVNGLTPDGRSMVTRAREECSQYKNMFGI